MALLVAALIAVLEALGHAALHFSGSGSWTHLLPFAATVLAIALCAALFLRGWLGARRRLAQYPFFVVPPLLASALALAALWFATRPEFLLALAGARSLVGGKAQAERAAIAHQVYAAYRRTDPRDFQAMFARAGTFEATVRDAATAFSVDAEVLMGVGAAESSFRPRDSMDGGRGLFQITLPPASVDADVRRRLGATRLDPRDHRHNSFLAAATLRHYLDDMSGDLFLGLLAYNIGPRNGGLRSIMEQYGARDFVTIQPYLHRLPRDYPIRVLSAALAYRLWRRSPHLPRYEEGANARLIQDIGIPGLPPE